MNKIKFILAISLSLVLMTFTACSSDDNNSESDDTLKLEGQWKFAQMNFTDDSVDWDPGVAYNSGTKFGYAPYMYTSAGVKGVDFKTQAVNNAGGDKLGNRFDYDLSGNFGQSEDEAYWYWNYTDDGFDVVQTNPAFPPFNFSLRNAHNVVQSENGNRVVFDAHVNSRVVGGPVTQVIQVPVQITLVKGTSDQPGEILIKGEPFVEPDQAS